jgi:hypothetical protein
MGIFFRSANPPARPAAAYTYTNTMAYFFPGIDIASITPRACMPLPLRCGRACMHGAVIVPLPSLRRCRLPRCRAARLPRCHLASRRTPRIAAAVLPACPTAALPACRLPCCRATWLPPRLASDSTHRLPRCPFCRLPRCRLLPRLALRRTPRIACPAAACPDASRSPRPSNAPDASLPPIKRTNRPRPALASQKPPPTPPLLLETAPTLPLLLETAPDPALSNRSPAAQLSPARCPVDTDASAGVGSAVEAAVEAQGAVAGREAAVEAAPEVVDAAPRRVVCGPLASPGRRPWISTVTASPCRRRVA